MKNVTENISAPGKSHQWYEIDKKLYNLEVIAMASFFPRAKYGFFTSNGAMWWLVEVSDEIEQQNTLWSLLLVYDQNHPSSQKGVLGKSSVKVYPIKPSYDEIRQLMSDWSPEEQSYASFRFYKDINGLAYFDIGSTRTETFQGENCENILTAAGAALRAKNWIDLFKRSLFDENYRKVFCNKKINSLSVGHV